MGEAGGDAGGVRVVARPHIAVIGASQAGPIESALAFTVGDLLVRAGAVIVCGGGGGVMEGGLPRRPARRRGLSRGGHPPPESGRAPLDYAAEVVTIGILPGLDRAAANLFVDVAIPTGMGELRNGLIVRAVDAVIAVGGAYGTLSEIALALRAGKRVVGLRTWELSPEQLPDDGFVVAEEAEEAVLIALEAARSAKL